MSLAKRGPIGQVPPALAREGGGDVEQHAREDVGEPLEESRDQRSELVDRTLQVS